MLEVLANVLVVIILHYVCQINTLYTLNLYNVLCPLYLNKEQSCVNTVSALDRKQIFFFFCLYSGRRFTLLPFLKGVLETFVLWKENGKDLGFLL